MTVEKYVKMIVKRIRCSRKKRIEIGKQLLSDISSELENGEKPEAVMSRMGRAWEVAEEFNQNLPESERKSYRRNRIIKFVLIIAVILVAAVGVLFWFLPKSSTIGSSGVFSQEAVEQQTKWAIQELDNHDLEGLKEHATDEMSAVLTSETIENARNGISDDWGDFRSFGIVYMSELKQRGHYYAVTQVTASYENVSVTYTITFDENMKLSGLYMK